MAMINCPECGKEISDKATQCIHCGCPIEQKNYDYEMILSGSKVNMTELFKKYNKQGFIVHLNKAYNIPKNEAEKIYQDCINRGLKNRNNSKKKDSQLSVAAAACSLFVITSPIGFVLACVDLNKKDENYSHGGSIFAIIMSCLITFIALLEFL